MSETKRPIIYQHESAYYRKEYDDFIDELVEDGDLKRDQAFALYGSASAYYEFGFMNLADVRAIEDRIAKEFKISIDELSRVVT